MAYTLTGRGFGIYEFIDDYGYKWNVQKSSSAEADKIWLGMENTAPQIMASEARKLGVDTTEVTGWVDYPIHKDATILYHNRMHLTQEQVSELIPILQYFVEHGELPEPTKQEG